VIEGYVHMLCIASSAAAYVVDQLELRGYRAHVSSGPDWARETVQVTFHSARRDLDLDFLRPDILPPRETS